MLKNVNNVNKELFILLPQMDVYYRIYKIVMLWEWIKIQISFNVGIVKKDIKLIILRGKVVKEYVMILIVLIVL